MKKIFVLFALATILFITACEQPTENRSGREISPEIDSSGTTGDNGNSAGGALLIEVWDSSTPPKLLGYDTGMGNEQSKPIILTSTGYCVELSYGIIRNTKRYYGPDYYNFYNDEYNELRAGCILLFATTSNPTDNDTAYYGSPPTVSRGIHNYVVHNPHDGGTYYTSASPVRQALILPEKFMLYDADGTLRNCNEQIIGPFIVRGALPSDCVGIEEYFSPLKKIGDYKVLGLPNPDDIEPPLTYKVRHAP
jgi:hypothetical protein